MNKENNQENIRKFFFYGTLRIPRNDKVTIIRKALVHGFEMWMYRNGWFPCAVASKDHKIIHGVVHDFSFMSETEFKYYLQMTDGYEGCPALYNRVLVNVTLPSGKKERAYMYKFNLNNFTKQEMEPIYSGDWTKR